MWGAFSVDLAKNKNASGFRAGARLPHSWDWPYMFCCLSGVVASWSPLVISTPRRRGGILSHLIWYHQVYIMIMVAIRQWSAMVDELHRRSLINVHRKRTWNQREKNLVYYIIHVIRSINTNLIAVFDTREHCTPHHHTLPGPRIQLHPVLLYTSTKPIRSSLHKARWFPHSTDRTFDDNNISVSPRNSSKDNVKS